MPTDLGPCANCCPNCPACSHCATLPLVWAMDLRNAGFTNGVNCLHCAYYNRRFALQFSKCSPCNWQDNTPGVGTCCGPCYCWELACGDFGGVKKWTITSFDTTIQYILNDASFNCNGSNTFALNFNSGCNTVPATVTIAPI